MGSVSDHRGLPLVLWLLHVSLLLCLGSATATALYYGWGRGVVKPDDPYLFVGEDLILFCNLTSLEQQAEDSSYLYFTRNGVEIQSQFITILTTRSIRLRYRMSSPEYGGHFVCWLRQEKGNPRTVGSQHVKADYRPVPVNEVNCTVFNWENMTCTWDLGRNYHHPEYITVALVWTIRLHSRSSSYDVQKDCPEGHMTNTSCKWVSGGPDGFLPGHNYIMSVVVTNTKRRIQAKSARPIRIDTNSIVKPSPVVNLHRNASNATCLWVMWSHTDMVHDKVAFVEYVSEWHPSQWHRMETIHFKRGPTRVEICGLTPHTEYIIRVAVRPLPRNSEDGYRSDWRYIERVRTAPSFPEVAPKMCAGCFTEVPCNHHLHPQCRNILVYWKHIPRALRRSVIHKYLLKYSSGNAEKDVAMGNNTTLYPNNSLIVSLSQDSNYTLSLYAVTSKNKLSSNHSSLTIPSEASKPEGPASLVVETAYANGSVWTGQFDLRWTPVGGTTSYIIFWCRGNTDTFVCDREEKNEVEWQEVTGDTSSFIISIASLQQQHDKPDNYIVGVARQVLTLDGQLISSGITWAGCYYHKNRRPRVPTTVDFAQVDRAGILRVTWQYNMCEKSGHDVYITRFIIFYCVIPDSSASSACQGHEHNTTARREAHSVTLQDLEPGAYYRVNMVADSEWGVSDYSETIQARVMAAEQHRGSPDYSIIGVVLAVLVILILILIGFCKLRRHFRKTQEKFNSFPDLPALPPDNPPSKTYYQRRPLPQPPQPDSTSAGATTTATSGVSSLPGTEKRRGGKHKSITSETSLLGHEDAGNDDDSKRRHKPAAGSISERSKLLADEGVTTETVQPVSKYDSDSGAESRYSSEDHDYASVEGGSGSAEEGGQVTRASPAPAQHAAPQGNGTTVRPGYLPKEAPLVAPTAHRHMQSVPEHKPAPSYAPPPLPQAPSSYIQAALVSGSGSPPPSLTSFKGPPPGQPAVKTGAGDKRHFGQQPAQLSVAMEPVSSVRAMPSPTLPFRPPLTSGGYVGNEGSTLPCRLPGSKMRPVIPSVPGTASTSGIDPYASTNITAFSSHVPPPPAPPPHQAHPGRSVEEVGVRLPGQGYVAHVPAMTVAPPPPVSAYSGSSTSSYSDDSRVSTDSSRRCDDESRHSDATEPIYSPPWESSTLLPLAIHPIDNRPLSEYMLNLPDTFFGSTPQVNDAPTTEL